MAGTSKVGKDWKVTIGANQILGIGTVTISGIEPAQLDDTEFGDDYNDDIPGVLNAGTISFEGNYKKDDTTGQDVLAAAVISGASVTEIRVYVDSVSYYTPNSSTDEGNPVAHCHVIKHEISADKGDLGKASFELKVNAGPMRLI